MAEIDELIELFIILLFIFDLDSPSVPQARHQVDSQTINVVTGHNLKWDPSFKALVPGWFGGRFPGC